MGRGKSHKPMDAPYERCVVTDLSAKGVVGLFQTVDSLRREGRLSPDEERKVDEAINWVRANLPRPELILDQLVRPFDEEGELVWCKRSASELLRRIQDVGRIVLADYGRGGVYVPCGHSSPLKLGQVIYEDDFVAVELMQTVNAEQGAAADRPHD